MSADLQKVIMLKKIDEFKTCVFTTRLVTFNETLILVSLVRMEKTQQLFGTKRHQADETRTLRLPFTSVLKVFGIKKKTFWPDNCSGQSKNWISYSYNEAFSSYAALTMA